MFLNTRKFYGAIFLILICFYSCNKLEYNPNQKFNKRSALNINDTNIEKLLKSNPDDTLRFVLAGDTHGSYDNLTGFVRKVNSMAGIDFVVINGDFTEYGILREFEGMSELLAELKQPYVGIVGNHDLVANGTAIFTRMYGKLNYSFVYDSVKFICYDSNSREYEFTGKVPDLPWLASQLQPQAGVKAFIPIAHVPPSFDLDRDLEPSYLELINNSQVLASLYAHKHQPAVFYYTPENGSTKAINEKVLDPAKPTPPYIVTGAIIKREFLIIEIVNGKLDFEIVKY